MNFQFPWHEIEKIFLDMDGVLLDRHFDDHFWNEFVPRRWQSKNGGTLESARNKLFDTYKQVEGTLAWYDLDYWSEQLDLDIPTMKREASKRIALRPGAIDFLAAMKKKQKPLYLVTNAHPKTLAVKLGKFDLRPWFEKIFSANDIGFAKEQPSFWEELQNSLSYKQECTFFADDTEKVLLSARKGGPQHLLHIAKPSSEEEAVFSPKFPSTAYLANVIQHHP